MAPSNHHMTRSPVNVAVRLVLGCFHFFLNTQPHSPKSDGESGETQAFFQCTLFEGVWTDSKGLECQGMH